MPVIGRLDGQVDELIISPISRRQQAEERPALPAGTPDRPGAPPDDGGPRAPTHTPRAGESSDEPGELPVWLL